MTRVSYDGLVVASGSVAKSLSAANGRVHTPRTIGDCSEPHEDLADAAHVAVIEGGFFGLEVAATARGMGLDVLWSRSPRFR